MYDCKVCGYDYCICNIATLDYKENSRELLKAAEILEKKASDLASFYMQNPNPIVFTKVDMYRDIAKALRGEE